MVILTLFYLLVPAGVIRLCNRVRFFGRLGPVLVLYALGIIAGNLPVMPENAGALQQALTSALIPLAIPMMLFNSDFRRFSFRKSLLTLLCGIVAVTLTVIGGFLIFRRDLGPEAAQIGGMLTGVYTGGTPNLAALKLMLGARDGTYILLNSYDMIVSFVYLIFLMGFGIRMFRRILPGNGGTAMGGGTEKIVEEAMPESYTDFFRRHNLVQVLKAVGLSVAVVGVSVGAAMLVPQKYFMVVVILSITTLGIAASFIPGVRRLEKSFDAGMYLVYIFSVVVASMADLSSLDFRGGISMFLYIVFVIFASLAVQTLLSRLLRIDADTMVISSVALINSPPMVPMIAASMKNREVIVTGLSVGIIGYAAGNYLGFLIYELLKLL